MSEKIGRKIFVIVGMPVFYMVNLIICYDNFFCSNIFSYTFVYVFIYFTDYMHGKSSVVDINEK